MFKLVFDRLMKNYTYPVFVDDLTWVERIRNKLLNTVFRFRFADYHWRKQYVTLEQNKKRDKAFYLKKLDATLRLCAAHIGEPQENWCAQPPPLQEWKGEVEFNRYADMDDAEFTAATIRTN